MKTKTIKIGILTVLTVIFSTTMWSNNDSGNENDNADTKTTTAIDVQCNLDKSDATVVSEFELFEPAASGGGLYNSPDPFLHVTEIFYTLSSNQQVTLTVIAPNGQYIVLVNEKQGRGEHSVSFNASGLPTGSYWAVLQLGSSFQIDPMTKKGGISVTGGVPKKN